MLASNRNSTFGGIPDPRSPPQPQSPQSHPPSHPPPPASYSGHHQHAQSAHMPIGSPPDARNYPGSLSSARTRTSSTQGDPPATGSDFRPSMRGAPMPTRSQSLRPLSAFQPLDNPDSYNGNGTSSPVLSGGPGSPRPPSPNGSVARSIRPATAPLTFKSPDLRNALALQDAQGRKTYMEGYLLRRDEQGADGKPLHVGDERRRWNLCFVQLGGTVLSIWSVQQMEDAAREGREVPPAYINVTDSFVDYVGVIAEDPNHVPGSRGRHDNVFALNSAGNNRILFCVEGQVGRRLVQAWVNAIRLASWEKIRLEEIYTGALIRARLGAVGSAAPGEGKDPAAPTPEMAIKSPLTKGKMEGWVKARFMGSTEWKKCWLVLSDHKPDGNEGKKKFWKLGGAGDRSSIMSTVTSNGPPGSAGGPPGTPGGEMETPPGSNGAPGCAQFFENKKAKKPFATLVYASHAFAVYPSRPELVEGSSLFKIEGAFPQSTVLSATHRIRSTGWAMLMPELEGSGSKGANAEMMKWVIAFMDSFKLYGRPDAFVWDARNPVSAFFAYPIGPYKERLFLDRELAEFLDVREERHLANRANLSGIMAARMRGERTPILPPLPAPERTTTARAPNASAREGSPSGSERRLRDSDEAPARDSSGSSAEPSFSKLPPLGGSLPLLDFGPSDDKPSAGLESSMGSDQFSRNSRGLDAIGERSREGSTFTPITSPQQSVSVHDSNQPGALQTTSRFGIVNDEAVSPMSQAPNAQPSRQSSGVLPDDNRSVHSNRQFSQASQQAAAPAPPAPNAFESRHVETSAPQSMPPSQSQPQPLPQYRQSQPQSQPQPPFQADARSQVQAQPMSADSSRSSGAGPADFVPVQTAPNGNGPVQAAAVAAPALAAAAAPPIAASRYTAANVQQQLQQPQQQQLSQQESAPSGPPAPAPSGRGAESNVAANTSNAATTNNKRESDSFANYDESVLFYMQSISDQLPAPAATPKAAPPSPTTPAASPPGSEAAQLADASRAPPVAESVNSHSTATQGQSVRSPPVRNAALPAHAGEDSIGDDALAVYSFLERPPSPVVKTQRTSPRSVRDVTLDGAGVAQGGASAAGPDAASAYAPAPAAQQPVHPSPTSYPSSFGSNKRAIERKTAAQLQAQAHQEALHKPGRPTNRKPPTGKGAHAWGEESSEEEEEEEEEEEDEDEAGQVPVRSRQPSATGSDVNGDGRRSTRALPSAPGGGTNATASVADMEEFQRAAMAAGLAPPNPMYAQQGEYGQYMDGSGPTGSSRPGSAGQSGNGHAGSRPISSHPSLMQQRPSVFNNLLGAGHGDDSRSNTPPSQGGPGRQTFVQLGSEDQPGAMTTVFTPHGLLQAGAQDKAERSAKAQEQEARAMGGHLVNVPNKPPPPQAGLLGAISAHERDRRAPGGLGATLTERERERVAAERRQREEDMQRSQTMQQIMGGPGGAGGFMGGLNPYQYQMWQQQQQQQQMMMMMATGGGMGMNGMNPMMGMGGYAPSAFGHMGGQMDPMMAQRQAMQAAQQAYFQAMSQAGGHEGSVIGGSTMGGGGPVGPQSMAGAPSMAPSMSMGMSPYLASPHMSMMGAPMGYPGFMSSMPGPPGSEFGMSANQSPNLGPTSNLGLGPGAGAGSGSARNNSSPRPRPGPGTREHSREASGSGSQNDVARGSPLRQ